MSWFDVVVHAEGGVNPERTLTKQQQIFPHSNLMALTSLSPPSSLFFTPPIFLLLERVWSHFFIFIYIICIWKPLFFLHLHFPLLP